MRKRLEANDLADAWERNAADWIGFVRSPAELDSHYHRYHRDLFLELVPPSIGRTLDLGCGEGRLARDLAARGYDLTGVDRSPTMLAAAQAASPELEWHLADAAALPLAAASFRLAIAFMSLQDTDDLDGAVREVARVLEPGGYFCLAVVHPLNSAGSFAADGPDSSFVIEGSYLDNSYFVDELVRGSDVLPLESVHRPLHAYIDALTHAGLLIEELREPRLPATAFVSERSPRWQRIPLFLHVRAVKPAA